MRSKNLWPVVLNNSPEDWQNGGFGIYVHWPFCSSKCPYCDFNSHVWDRVDQEKWREAFRSEIARHAELVPNRILNSIYFGGGTPSLMEVATIDAILSEINKHWHLSNDIEITLEANPSSVEAARFEGYAKAGVNRVSLGVQALNDTDLRYLGRLHSADEARRAIDLAAATFGRYSFDLIYARQFQTTDAWKAELNEALSLAGDHLSLYQLTIEPGTVFGDRHRVGKLPGLPDEDFGADAYEMTAEICGAAGFENYEISNFAKDGARSSHNLIYWKGGDYIGVGPGAHGRVTINGQRIRTETHLAPGKWLGAATKNKSGTSVSEPLSPKDHAEEMLMMGLRLNEGISVDRYETIARRELSIPPMLFENDLVVLQNGTLRATATGRLLLNQVIQSLLVG